MMKLRILGCDRGMLLPVVSWSYATWALSNPKIEKTAKKSVAFHFTAAKPYQNQNAIASLTNRFINEFKPLFFKGLMIAHGVGLKGKFQIKAF